MADGDHILEADNMQSAEFVVLRDLMMQTKDAVDSAIVRMDGEIATTRRDVVDIRERHADLDKIVAGVCSSFTAAEDKIDTLVRHDAEVYPVMKRVSANGFMDRLQSVMGTVDSARGLSVRAMIALATLATSLVTGLSVLGLQILAAHMGWAK